MSAFVSHHRHEQRTRGCDECDRRRHVARRRDVRFGHCDAGQLQRHVPVNCNLGSLAVGGSAIVTIVVTPSAAGQIINTATVTASESDSDSTNNTASTTTLIQPAAASPTMLDDNLTVSTVITGLDQPTSSPLSDQTIFLFWRRRPAK